MTTRPRPCPARRTPSDGHRRAIEAHRQAVRPPLADLGTAKEVERQTAAMRELTRRAFPELDVVADDALAPIEQARPQRRRHRGPDPMGMGNGSLGESLFTT